jgi:hypothetical protein
MNGRAAQTSSAASWALLALVTLALLLVARSYYLHDRRPPTFDDAWFLETSLNLYHRLTENGLGEFVSAYAGSFRTKAPLISVLPLPFYLLLGTRPQSAILVNLAFIVITNIYLFLLARRLFSAAAGVAAALFYQTMPLAYGLSRIFLADYGLACLTVMFLYHLVGSERLSRTSSNVALGVIAGLGLLMKVLFPLYVAGPLLVVSWQASRSGSLSWRALAGIAVPATLLAATWYPFHLTEVFLYAWQAGYGEIGGQYGGGLAVWLAQVVQQGVTPYYAAALLICGLAALVSGQRPASGVVWLLLGWIVLPLAALAAGRNREIRFLLPVLPALAIVLAGLVCRLVRRPALQAVALAALAFYPLRIYAAYSFPEPLRARLGFSDTDLGWARPPDQRGDWDQRRVLEALEHLGLPSLRARYVVIGAEHPFFNANLFQYLNAYTRYPFVFSSLGYAESSAERAVERIYRLDTRYLVMPDGLPRHELAPLFNQVNDEIQAQLDRSVLGFHLRTTIALTPEVHVGIWERDAGWEQVAAATPTQPLAVDFAGGLRLLGCDWKRRNPHLCEFSYYLTAPGRVVEDYRVNLEFRRRGEMLAVQDQYVTGGAHPPFEWSPGEIVKQTITVWAPAASHDPVEARLWLTSWGLGDPQPVVSPVSFARDDVVALRLAE